MKSFCVFESFAWATLGPFALAPPARRRGGLCAVGRGAVERRETSLDDPRWRVVREDTECDTRVVFTRCMIHGRGVAPRHETTSK